MGLVAALTAGLVVWIVLWALGTKGIDSFLITIAIMLVAAMTRAATKYLPGNRST
jgi:hypothetical protein